MNENLYSKEEIDSYINDLTILGQGIIRLDNLIVKIKDPSIQTTYQQELKNLVTTYYELEQDLKSVLKNYIKTASRSGNVVNFSYYKLNKSLNK